MTTRLFKHITRLATMDAQRREISDASIFVRDHIIEWVGASAECPYETADEIHDLRQHVVIPGMVNTHHHMVQSLTRVIAQENELFGWLTTLYPIWRGLRSQHIYVSAQLAMAELMLSGCTTSSDHLYIYPNDCKIDDEIQAAQEIGIRFHVARGAMSVGESKGGLPPDDVVEADEQAILRDTRRIIEQYHDAQRHAMLRVVVAPCAPFTVSQDLMRESAQLARSYGVRLHTHLAENINDVEYSLATFGQRPGDYAESIGWVGEDVWHAHCVQLNSAEIDLFARTGTGVAHCPCSNCRLASGVAPIRAMLNANVKVGLGVDGSASSDSGNLLNEARMAMLLQRSGGNPAILSAREALEMATLGGAKVLGRDDIGAIAVGMSADFVAYDLRNIAFAGAQHDPIAALVFCNSVPVTLSVIHGKIVVKEGQLTTIDLPVLIETHNRLSLALINKE
jgi:cytosine/adenosine deaminase-related metal-dependent hydrolase